MIRKLLPILLALVGLGAGLGAGIFLRPPPADPAEAEAEAEHAAEEEAAPPDYVKLNNQFVVPLLSDGRVMSLVVLSLSLEVAQGHTEDVYSREPKIRDVFLQVLFDHANSGGFRGSFTDGSNLVEVAISRLRKKIEKDPARPDRLLTVRGIGYRFSSAKPVKPEATTAGHKLQTPPVLPAYRAAITISESLDSEKMMASF